MRHSEMAQRGQLVRRRVTIAVDERHQVVGVRLRVDDQLRVVVQEIYLQLKSNQWNQKDHFHNFCIMKMHARTLCRSIMQTKCDTATSVFVIRSYNK